MKYLIFWTILAASVTANASGKLSVTGSDYAGHDKVYPTLGLSVDEKIMGPVFITSWVGYGTRPVHSESKEWAAGKLGFDLRFKLVTLGAGAFANSGTNSVGSILGDEVENGAYAKATLNLW